MFIRIVGETPLKVDCQCPHCKQLGKRKGSVVEVVEVSEEGKYTNLQMISFNCINCHEQVMTR